MLGERADCSKGEGDLRSGDDGAVNCSGDGGALSFN